MCGIGFLLEACPADQSELGNYISALRRRGPDADKQTDIKLQGGRRLHLIAAVLHLRGDRLCAQPAEDAHGNVLLWNGEVFDGLDVGPSESDTAKVLQMLSRTRSHQEVVAALGRISGPFSLVYWCPARRALYYGRDPAGRRSLVVRRPRTPEDSLAVLSCLPELAGPGDTGSAKPPITPPSALHRQHQPDSGGEDVRPPRAPEPPPDAAAINSETHLAPRPRWEEVNADGIYVLSVDNNSSSSAAVSAPPAAAASEAEAGGNGDWCTATPCAELYPWSLLRAADGAKRASRAPVVASDPLSSPERRQRGRRRSRCVGDNTTSDSSNCEGKGENGVGFREGDGPVKRTTGARVVLESKNAKGGGGATEEQLVTPEATPKAAASVLEEGDRAKPSNGPEAEGETAGDMPPAAAGLLARLRDSIQRRVRTVPYPTYTTPTASPRDVTRRPRRTEGGGGGTARGTGIVLQGGHDKAAQGGAQGEGGMRAAAVGRQGNAGKDAETCDESSRGGGPFECVASGFAPVASRVGVLFSGGLDSVVLAAMLAEEGGGRPAVPKGEAIDLINVCFDSPSGHQSPDRLASIAAVDELKSLFPSHGWRLVCVDASYDDVLSQTGAVWRVMQPCTTTMDFNIAAAFWFASRGTGWLYQPRPRPPTPRALREEAGADVSDPHPPPRGSTASEARESGTTADGVGSSTMPPSLPPSLPPTSPATAAVGVLPAGSGDSATGTPRAEGHSSHVSSEIPTGRTPAAAPAAAAAKDSQEGSETSGSGSGGNSKGKKASKLNKNSAELCPVGGCRRLLKPGCVFDMCSRCCLKAQGLVDASAASPSSSSDTAMPPETKVDREQATAAVATTADSTSGTAAREEGAAVAGSSARASNRQRACKARAEAEATRALEARLLDRFGPDLPPPFRPEALAALLISRQDAGAGASTGAKARPDRYRDRESFCPRLASNSGRARPQPIKWCPIHKRPRRKGESGGDGGGASPGAEVPDPEEERVGRRLGDPSAVITSSARVLLVGIGADEFMGGYSRHRNAFNRGGDGALAAELGKDQARLWTRNLGRDDRSIADHGREARFPFLDEDVVGYIRSLPLRDVCDMDQPAGLGDKKILREVAAHLGLDSCRSLPKRAIQFGSRIAQHCARHTHGSHRRGSGSDPASAAGVP
eukprot:g14154.t1